MPTQGTMEELWETILWYLKKCNRDEKDNYSPRGLHKLIVTATPSGVKYSVPTSR